MEFVKEAYDWVERTFWNSLTKKLMSFLLLFFIDLGYLAIYFQQKRLVADAFFSDDCSHVSLHDDDGWPRHFSKSAPGASSASALA